jgi:anaerobic ribonucleoside-triphosphate reductase activating protein
MNYADIKQYDVANGIGVRVSLFVSGCTHHCKDCFNKEAWDFAYGNPFTQKEENDIITYLKPGYVAGLSLLGGEPLEPVNQEGLLPLLRRVRKEYPEKTIWCYTGYLFDRDVMGRMYKESDITKELISYIDILVDGEFEVERKNLKVNFRGSDNQRIIDVKKSLKTGEVIHWEGEVTMEENSEDNRKDKTSV